ncbi:hypothetical protein [Pedobacter sp. ASV12]|uniref:hypothetical protein n=1 Tax=Pedobacter sp. ASV12 TaxID=2795120 RepID=UPI0018EBC6C5|nr:hypothetical protein [Pedobacter sp. ASV12]
MNKKFLLLCVAIAVHLQLIAQTNTANYMRNDLISPSATAGTLGRFGDASINQSSGAPSFSIPIFNVSGHELSVPISLSYSYDGFKPSNPVGWTGLGWSLQAGGVITRQVKGKVDNISTSGNNFEDAAVQSKVNLPIGDISTDQAFLKNIADGNVDAEPDLYSFNFAGYSGKFMLVGGTFYCFPYQKLKITGSTSGFTITAEDGTKYEFNVTETTQLKTPGSTAYNSSWYLSSITNAAGTETIKFIYTSESQYDQVGTNSQTYKKFDEYFWGATSTLYPATYATPSKISPKRLVQIVSEKYTVDFSGTSRSDVASSAAALSAISISDNSGNEIKNFKLKYGYFGTSTNYLERYLKLKALEEWPTSGILADSVKKQVHSFEYIGESGAYPDKSNAFVDHFGYYAGGNFGATMIPGDIYPGGPNRDPNPINAQAGALKKITYPTGGNTAFEYEGNVAYNGIDYVKTLSSLSSYVNRPPGTPLGSFESDFESGKFSINFDQTVGINLIRNPKSVPLDSLPKGSIDARLYREEEEGIYSFVGTMKILHDRDDGGMMFNFNLSAGTYYVQTYIDEYENAMTATVGYRNNTTTPIEGKPAGGIRVKNITNNPVVGVSTQKSYRYVNSAGFSTGHSAEAVYDVKPFTQRTVETTSVIHDTHAMNYSSFISEGPTWGSPNYYNTVFEDLVGDGETLTTRSDYVSYDSYYAGIQPVKVTKYKNTSGGKVPISKTEYEYGIQDGVTINGIKVYQHFEVVNLGGMYGDSTKLFTPTRDQYYQAFRYLKKTREVSYEGTDSLVTVTNNSYDLADTKNLTMTRTTASNGDQLISKFKYPDSYTTGVSGAFTAAHILTPAWEQQVWRKTGTDSVLVSAGITEYSTSSFKPVKQYALTTKGIAALNGEGMSGTKYSSLLSDSRYEERVAYGYDGAGRLVSQQLTGGIPVSYQWAYPSNLLYTTPYGQKNYVIAEAKNALPTEFYHENFEEYSGASSGTAHTGGKFYSGDFYVSWSIPNARAYVLSYWYRDGGTWKYQEQAYTGAVTLALGDAIDDVRIHPKDAQLGTYVYKSGVGISASTDAKGLTTYSEFDEFNRLKNVKDQDGNIVKNYSYHLAGQPAETGGGSSGPTTAISYLNWTTPYTPGGTPSAYISSLAIKDGSGTTLYTYNTAQLQAGITVPQGTYSFVITVSGMAWDPWTDLGWASCYVVSGAYSAGFDNTTSTYTLTGVTLNGATATINLDNIAYL